MGLLPGACRAPFCRETSLLPPLSPHCWVRIQPGPPRRAGNAPLLTCSTVPALSRGRGGVVFTSALTAQPQACMPQAYSRCLINPGKMTMPQSGNVNCHCQSEAERRGSRRWVRGAREGEVGARGRVPVGEGGLGSAAQGGRWFPYAGAAPGQRLSAALSRGRRVPAPRRERFRRTGDESNNSTCARTAARATAPAPDLPHFFI